MNIQQIKTVCEITKRRFNMSLAAAVLHRSQPALSRQIAELESELGFRVFSRTSNRIVGLTPLGEQVLAIGERVTREMDALRELGAGSADGGSELRIATTHTHARYALPRVIKRFTEQWPHVLLNLRQGDPAQCFQLIARGEADLGITVEIERIPRDVITIPIYRLARCVLAPRGHPLSHGKLTLKRVAEYPMIAYSRPPDWRWLFEGAFADAHLKPRIVLSALDADVSKTYVSLGIGIAILATMAFEPAKDSGLSAIDADHLFRPGILTAVFRRGVYIPRHAQAFLSGFCPHMDTEFFQQCVDGMSFDRQKLLRSIPLTKNFIRQHA
jgi:LysR family transcriptional regulator, cys regulon transcriptional activator